jgi:hypothetical protein
MNIKEWLVETKNKSPYLKYSKNYLTQFGDDGIIEQIINELDINNSDKLCVEFGAWDGVYLSNVYNLWRNKNFKAILIEGDLTKANELNRIKSDNIEVHGVFVSPISGDENSLDSILDKSKFNVDDNNFFLLSIDVDGLDYNIWESVSKYKPQLVVIEIAGGWSVDTDYIGVGASLKSLNILAKRKDYTLICATGNAYFIRNDKLKYLQNYNENLLINDYYLDDDTVANIFSKIDENGNIMTNYRFKDDTYLQFVITEKNKLV